eukprot:6414609-Prorocentrum_lima.AAC.1
MSTNAASTCRPARVNTFRPVTLLSSTVPSPEQPQQQLWPQGQKAQRRTIIAAYYVEISKCVDAR